MQMMLIGCSSALTRSAHAIQRPIHPKPLLWFISQALLRREAQEGSPTRTSVMIWCQMECRFASLAANSRASAERGASWRHSLRSGLVKPLQH